MPSIHRFVVVPAVPEKLKALTELANNLWTLWNYDASGLFRRLDPELWESTKHNPVRVLSRRKSSPPPPPTKASSPT